MKGRLVCVIVEGMVIITVLPLNENRLRGVFTELWVTCMGQLGNTSQDTFFIVFVCWLVGWLDWFGMGLFCFMVFYSEFCFHYLN